MAEVRIREATRNDAGVLAAVHLDTVLTAYAGLFPTAAPPPTADGLTGDWQDAFDDPSFQAFLAEDGSIPVGTVAIRDDPDSSDCGELRRLHVTPIRWRAGVGTTLHDTALDVLRARGHTEAWLWVLKGNHRARAFYEGHGWRLVPHDELRQWSGVEVVEVRYRIALT